MKTKLILMRPLRPEQISQVELPENPSTAELHAVIDPLLGTINFEHVLVYPPTEPDLGKDHYRDMFVDEIGAMNGLARNERATTLYRRNFVVHERAGDPEDLPAIYGPAVFFPERKVW